MKLTEVTALCNFVRVTTEDPSRIEIVKRMKLQNTVWKQITTLAGIRKKLLIGKAA